MKRLEGRVAIVTGGANGIGRGISMRFSQEGAIVALIDREAEALSTADAEIAALGGQVLTEQADCTDAKAAADFVARVERDYGRIDILVNNVGQGARERKTSFLESDESVWRFVVELNLFTTMRFSRLAVPAMVRNAWGRIINISSESAVIAPVGSHDYAAAKAAVIGFTRAVAREFAPHSITVNALCPGPIKTRALDRPEDAAVAQAIATIPVGFIGDVSDVAAVATLLASEEGRFITGQSILVNGGRWWL
jgi:NAD(P)-dependent dehydrogenase (short-subunit alcohol dehydrogenase family)